MTRKMKDSGIEWVGEIPENWYIEKNKRIFKKKKDIVGDDFRLYSLLSLTKGGIKEKDINNPEGKLPATFATYQKVEKEDLVLCLFDLDVSAVFSGISPFNGIISPAYSIYKIKETYNPRFYHYFFEMIGNRRHYMIYAKSLRKTINTDGFDEIFSLVPPTDQQEKIANFLDEKTSVIDKIITDSRHSIEELKKYKKSLITEIVTNGLDKKLEFKDSGIDWIGETPFHWDINKINRLFEIKKVIANENGHHVLSVTQKGLKIKDISKNAGQMAADYSKYQIVNKDDFVMNHMDLLTGWVDCSNYEGVTSPDYRVFKNKNKEVADNTYYKYVFQTCYTNKIFYGLGQGVSNLGRWRLQTDKFLNFYIPVPPLDEQIKIAEYIDQKVHQIDELIIEKENIIKEFETYKKSLVYEYVTGKKEVL